MVTDRICCEGRAVETTGISIRVFIDAAAVYGDSKGRETVLAGGYLIRVPTMR